MKNKVWNKTVIATEEQNVEIYPTEGFDGIIVETRELDDKTQAPWFAPAGLSRGDVSAISNFKKKSPYLHIWRVQDQRLNSMFRTSW